ncbi:hypothetical protein F4819DRAFT_491236 [Hypoxylon fuscum]|nr:hypothetical protein F4819DRAFT_491236 [Hypoxylon fuscum]
MGTIKYPNLMAFFLLCTASLVAARSPDEFRISKCPISYIRVNTDDVAPKMELVTTCFSDDGGSQGYRTSKLDIGPCFINDNGTLGPIGDPNAFDADTPFTKSCYHCGLFLNGPWNDDQEEWKLSLRCNCRHKPKDIFTTEIDIGEAIKVDKDGIPRCFDYKGEEMNNSTESNDLFPKWPQIGTTSNTTVSSGANVTVTVTATGSCAVSSESTTTKKHKHKTKTITKTAKATTPVPITVFITPTPSIAISANLKTTVHASFTTITA